MAATWDQAPDAVWLPALEDYLNIIRQQVDRLVHHYAAEIEAWMKEKAPWFPFDGWDGGRVVPLPPGYSTTGNARQTLSAEVERMALDMWSILLAGGVDYFVWLELANQGRYAILGPAIEHFGPLLFADLQAILS